MPTKTAGSIINKVQIVLVDETNVRWNDTNELLVWLNEGQREIAMLRPDACNKTVDFTCAAGSRQQLPAEATALVEVVRNVNGPAVRKVSWYLMDAVSPGWHTETAGATENFLYDPRTPREFYVYPPAVADAGLVVRYQTSPMEAANLSATISVDDIYEGILVDYVLWRAYSKDGEYAATKALADVHRASFEKRMGVKTQADGAQLPREAR